jgi:hypothetical protein
MVAPARHLSLDCRLFVSLTGFVARAVIKVQRRVRACRVHRMMLTIKATSTSALTAFADMQLVCFDNGFRQFGEIMNYLVKAPGQ